MRTKIEVIYYVYCFNCRELIYEGSLRGAVGSECKFANHNTDFGTKKFFEITYPKVKTTDWENSFGEIK